MQSSLKKAAKLSKLAKIFVCAKC